MQNTLQSIGRVVERFRHKYPKHTLLPNSLFSIAPFPVFGYDDEIGKSWGYISEECKAILESLKKDELWQEYSKELRSRYENFQYYSNNEVLWMGWTYWHPYTKDRRTQGSLTRSDTVENIIKNDFVHIKLGHRAINEPLNMISRNSKEDSRQIWGKRIWELFWESRNAFENNGNYLTINDYLYSCYKSNSPDKEKLRLTNRVFLFAPGFQFEDPGILKYCNALIPTDEQIDGLWNWVIGSSDPAMCDMPKLWMKAAKRILQSPQEIPVAVSDALHETARLLGIKGDNRLIQAYVILQHLAFYHSYLAGNFQYSFPVAIGKNLCLMMMGMNKSLTIHEILAWRGIAMDLLQIASLQHLNEFELERQYIEREGSRMQLFSHSLTKAFTTPLKNICDDLENSLSSSCTSMTQSNDKTKQFITFIRSHAEIWGDEFAEMTHAPFRLSEEINNKSANWQIMDAEKYLSRRFSIPERVCLSDIKDNVRKNALNCFQMLALNDLYDDKRFKSLKERIDTDNWDMETLVDLRIDLPPKLVWGHEPFILHHLWNLVQNSLLSLDYLPVLRYLKDKINPPSWIRPWIKVDCQYPSGEFGQSNPQTWFALITVRDSGRGFPNPLREKIKKEILEPCREGKFSIYDRDIREKLEQKRYSTRSGPGMGRALSICADYLSRLCIIKPKNTNTQADDYLPIRGRLDIPEDQPPAGEGAIVQMWIPMIPTGRKNGYVVAYEEERDNNE